MLPGRHVQRRKRKLRAAAQPAESAAPAQPAAASAQPATAQPSAAPSMPARTASPTLPRPASLTGRSSERAVAHGLRSLALALGLALVAGCSDSRAGSGLNEVESRAAVDQLVVLFRPVNPIATSDVHDRNFRERAAHLEALHRAGATAGREALGSSTEASGASRVVTESTTFTAPYWARSRK